MHYPSLRVVGRDFIGDIHGHVDALERMLELLGYRRSHGWRHPQGRILVFAGDLIDRGPCQVETVLLVRHLVESGIAVMIMANHEFNAIMWATQDPETELPLRSHTDKNRHQHAAFLDAFEEGSDLYHETIAWFRTLPLWIDFGDCRIVHACWNEPAIVALQPWLDDANRLTEEGFLWAGRKGTAAYHAVEILLKGQEMDLPDGLFYHDPDGTKRHRSRVAWWMDGSNDLAEVMLVPRAVKQALPITPVAGPELHGYPVDAPPCIIGHYWLTGTPAPLLHNLACIDYSVAKRGNLVAYRWDGEPVFDPAKFFAVPAEPEAVADPGLTP